MLAELERSNLLVSRLEHGGWYRVHSLLAEFAAAQLAAIEPAAAPAIHRRAGVVAPGPRIPGRSSRACGRRGRPRARRRAAGGAPPDPDPHRRRTDAACAGCDRCRTTRSCGIPSSRSAAATAATMVGRSALEQRRLLQLAERARADDADRFTPVRRGGRRDGARRDGRRRCRLGRVEGRRAVELAEAAADERSRRRPCRLRARALLRGRPRRGLGGGDAGARASRGGAPAARSCPRPFDARARRRREAATCRALAPRREGEVDRRPARRQQQLARRERSRRTRAVLAAEGHLADAEREFAYAERFFRDEVATVHHAWLLVVLARVRCGRGRLDEARSTLRAARDELSELAGRRTGTVTRRRGRGRSRARDVARRRRRGPRVPRATPSSPCCGCWRPISRSREIGGELFLSPNTVRTHTRAIYRKLGVSSRADAVARAGELGLLREPESPG